MIVEYHPSFKKNFKKRIADNRVLTSKYKTRLILFCSHRSDPILKDHGLTGSMRNFRSFSVTGDIRVIYIQDFKNHVIFIDIGSHNQVY